MNALPGKLPFSSDISGRMITLTLALHKSDKVSVRSCEVVGKGFRNRISFKETTDIGDVFVSHMSDAIRSCLQSLPVKTHVLSLPDFVLELPGLALAGVHLMLLEAKNDVRNAILRFREFLGSVNSAFRIDTGFHNSFSDYSEKLAINVLADICLPILNLSRSIADLEYDPDSKQARVFANRAQEFEFQTELLKRFIFNASIGHAEAPAAYLHPETEADPCRLLS